MARPYPARGSLEWGQLLKQYIDGTAGENSAAAQEAAAARDAAVAARDYLEGIVVTDLGTSDGQTAALIASESSQTRSALDDVIAAADVGGGGGGNGGGGGDGLAERNNDIVLDAADETFANFRIRDDGTTHSNDWPDRFTFRFRAPGGTEDRLTTWFNEYGEYRGAPAKHNTTAFRVFLKERQSDQDHNPSSLVFEVADDRGSRNSMMGVSGEGVTHILNGLELNGDIKHGTGRTTFGGGSGTNVTMNLVVTYPSGSEPSTTGVPDGTLWVEYTP